VSPNVYIYYTTLCLLTIKLNSKGDGDWGVGYNEFNFFWKMKNPDPVMGAKLQSKTHLLNTFFLFFEPFFARLASKFKKVLI
jgi:hypothetical protein